MAIYPRNPCHAAPGNHVSQQSDTNQTEASYTTQCNTTGPVMLITLGLALLPWYYTVCGTVRCLPLERLPSSTSQLWLKIKIKAQKNNTRRHCSVIL